LFLLEKFEGFVKMTGLTQSKL